MHRHVRLTLCALAIPAACALAADRYEHFPNPPVHMVTWFPRQDVNVYMAPRRPHAGAEVVFSFEIADRETKEPLAGPLTVALDREGLFGHVTHVAEQRDVQHDAGFPGEYTLRAVPPVSGLYILRVASREAGPGADATLGLGVWPAGVNRWTIVPLVVLCALSAFAIARTNRAAPGNPRA